MSLLQLALVLWSLRVVVNKKRGTKHLDGRVACKLVADNYGRSEWWVLLEPVAS